jgi:hypothetical protein
MTDARVLEQRDFGNRRVSLVWFADIRPPTPDDHCRRCSNIFDCPAFFPYVIFHETLEPRVLDDRPPDFFRDLTSATLAFDTIVLLASRDRY